MAKQESRKFIYKPRETDPPKIGWTPPVLDMHGRFLITPEIVHFQNPSSVRVIVADEPFETDDPHLIAFCKSHRSFRSHWGN
jgi:hypothetical protein